MKQINPIFIGMGLFFFAINSFANVWYSLEDAIENNRALKLNVVVKDNAGCGEVDPYEYGDLCLIDVMVDEGSSLIYGKAITIALADYDAHSIQRGQRLKLEAIEDPGEKGANAWYIAELVEELIPTKYNSLGLGHTVEVMNQYLETCSKGDVNYLEVHPASAAKINFYENDNQLVKKLRRYAKKQIRDVLPRRGSTQKLKVTSHRMKRKQSRLTDAYNSSNLDCARYTSALVNSENNIIASSTNSADENAAVFVVYSEGYIISGFTLESN